MTDIRCPLAEAARQFPDRPALATDSQIISYREYARLVTRTTLKLKKAGVPRGQRVAVLSPNCVEYPIVLMALFRLGAIACPISPHLPDRTVIEYLNRIRCRIVVGLSSRPPADHADSRTWLSFTEVVDIAGPSEAPSDEHLISLDQEATIVGTSGTSARPKAVLHSYGGHYYSAVGSNKNIQVRPGDRWLLSLGLYHVGGLAILFRTMLGGGSVVIVDQQSDLLDSIRRHKITHLSLVCTQLHRLLCAKPGRDDLKWILAVLVGGSAIPGALITQACESGLPLFTSYGLTEMASQVTTTRPGDLPNKAPASGRLLEYRQLSISSSGEILVKGDTLFRGYVEHDNLLPPVDRDGWFHTGDLGYVDDSGYLSVIGRQDSMFISGGENIYPEEIEGTLSLLDYVSDAVAVPVEDDEFGSRPAAVIQVAGNKKVCKRDMVAELEQHLPRFKIPVRFYVWPEDEPDRGLKPARIRLLEMVKAGGLTELT